MKHFFTKEYWDDYRIRHEDIFRFWLSVIATKSVVVSFCVASGGLLGILVFRMVRMGAFLAWGAVTLPYTESPISLFGWMLFGGIAGLIISEYLAARRFYRRITSNAKFPDILPAGTQWHEIFIRFLNEENVFIAVREFKRQASYVEMGFADKRGKTHFPNKQWELLILLAKKKGVIASDDKNFDFANKKRKQSLSETLQEYFRLEADPFHPYENENAYRIRMTLAPPPEKVSVGMKPSFMEFAQNIRDAKGEEAGHR